MSFKESMTEQVKQRAGLLALLEDDITKLGEIADVLIACFRTGNKVLLFGNGGSASIAEHVAAELEGRFYLDREPLPAYALVSNSATLTAIGNDYGYEEVFSRRVRAMVNEGDVVIGMSTSGESVNVIRGLEEASARGAKTVAFIGKQGTMKNVADYCFTVSSGDTPQIQEIHLVAWHMICGAVEQELFGTR